MYQTRQELMKKHNPSNQAERRYVDLFPGSLVWVQHRQGATWEPAMVVSQAAPNSYWIVQGNGQDQPKTYRRSRHMLKIRTSPHNSDQITTERKYTIDNKNAEFQHLPTLNSNRNQLAMNSIKNYTTGEMQTSLHPPVLPNSLENREDNQELETFNDSILDHTVNIAPTAPTAPVHQRKSTRENLAKPSDKYSDFYM